LFLGGRKEISIKMDEDQLQILDDLPSSAVELQVKDKVYTYWGMLFISCLHHIVLIFQEKYREVVLILVISS
jgi:hypothetical protein